jgi:DNA-binding response OmpR family regulator
MAADFPDSGMADELKDKKILIVDDDPDVVQSIKAALADTGASLDAAGDGNAALERALTAPPDLMILDMMLPKRSGFLVLERVKKGKKKTDPPRVIMITGNPGSRHRVYAENLGVDLYLTKPFRMDRLVQSVKELLS